GIAILALITSLPFVHTTICEIIVKKQPYYKKQLKTNNSASLASYAHSNL
ncbi:conserved hypothetical protein, partial [Trichinella spiralis]